nr:TolC family protein [Kofleriaceae bacterium]
MVLFAMPLAAPADAPAPPAIKTLLADPVQLAAWLRDHDPQIEAARAKVEAARAAGDQTRVLPNPQLSVGVGGIYVAGAGSAFGATGFGDTSNISIGVGELFEIGKRGPRQAAADLRTREAGESGVATLGGELSTAQATLGKLAYAAARHEVVATNLAAAQKLEASEKNRVDKKDMSPLDFERLELDTHELEIALQRADADVAAAVAGCSAALYAPCAAAGLDATALDAAAPLPDVLPDNEHAVAARPVHQAEMLEHDALGEDASLADNRKIPDPTIGIAYTFDNFGGDIPQSIAFSVGIPLPFFDRGSHDAAAARANAHAAEAQSQAEVRQERGSVESLVQSVTALRAALARLEKESLPTSEDIVAKTKKAYDLGEVGFTDLLLAERANRDLMLEVLDTRYDLFNARAQLRQALGLDDEAARGATTR